jgi:hypothetical protein
MLSRRQMLIPSLLSLATGYAAPAFAQGLFLNAMTHAGASSGESGELGDPICCVHANIGRPDLVTPAMAAQCNLDPSQLYRGLAASLPYMPLVPDRRVSSGPFAIWPGLTWNGDGELVSIILTMTNNESWSRVSVGEWASSRGARDRLLDLEPIPEQPSLAEWYAGAPITGQLVADPMPGWTGNAQAFESVYGVPWTHARVQVLIYWVEPLWFVDYDRILGGRITVDAFPYDPGPRSDWNGDGSTTIADVFAFLSDWFTDCPRAGSVDGVGGCTPTDIFCFLSEWFAGR